MTLSVKDTPIARKKTEQWIKPLVQREQASIELICFPFAGGGTIPYQAWGPLLSTDVNLSAVLLPGREVRIQQAPESCINIVCDAIVRELLQRHLTKTSDRDKKWVFFGHSMGSMLAYEVARRLQHQQVSIQALMVSGRQAPHLHFGGTVHSASDEVLIQEIKRFGQTPDIVFDDPEMRRLILPMLRADYTLLENYRVPAIAALDCPLLTCTGEGDAEVTPAQIQRWDELAKGGAQHQIFPGDHFYLLKPSTRQQLLDAINAYLATLSHSNDQ